MDRQPVKSSFIAAIGYDTKSQTLEVEFANGRIYQYLDFGPEVFAALQAAESFGKFLNASIVKNYKSRRAVELEEKPPDESSGSVLPGMQDEGKS